MAGSYRLQLFGTFYHYSSGQILCISETDDRKYTHLENENKERRDGLQQRRKGKAEGFIDFFFSCVCHTVEILAELQTVLNTTLCAPDC